MQTKRERTGAEQEKMNSFNFQEIDHHEMMTSQSDNRGHGSKAKLRKKRLQVKRNEISVKYTYNVPTCKCKDSNAATRDWRELEGWVGMTFEPRSTDIQVMALSMEQADFANGTLISSK